jgi:UTP pyrophosphatase
LIKFAAELQPIAKQFLRIQPSNFNAHQHVNTLKYLQHYPAAVLAQVSPLIAAGSLGAWVAQRHPQMHDVRSDGALFAYANTLKLTHLRNAPPLSKVAYDNRLHVVLHTLGTHTQVSRVQGNKLKAKHEIRIASTFKAAPAAFLKMIVVHELAHLKEREHNKSFYALCEHMEPDYHQLEFELRLWLTALETPQKA